MAVSRAGVPLPNRADQAAPGAVYMGTTETSGKAIGSLICGIFFFVLPSAILAVILGHWSHSDIRNAGGRLKGRGLGTAGLVLGYMGVALIPLIIAAIAIPNLLRARIAANEASAVMSLRAMNTGLMGYGAEYGNGFPSSLDVLASGDPASGNCNHAALLDSSYARKQRSGYVFYYSPVFPDQDSKPTLSPKATAANCTSGGASGYRITADPANPNSSGVRHFFTDQTGLIRHSEEEGSATADSTPLE